MRFVPVEQVKDGMIVGKRIYGMNGQLLLNQNAKIHSSYIKKIKELGYIGIYVEDEISSDIVVNDVVDENLKYEAVNAVKFIAKKVETGRKISSQDYLGISHIVGEMLDQIMEDKNILINIIDLKTFDDYTFSHCVNVGVLSMSLGAYMNMSRLSLSQLGFASIMHDLGKMFVPKYILNKPGKLNDLEFEIMKSHSYEGYNHLKSMFKLPPEITSGILDHHERPDGSGYPNNKKENEISKFGAIISVADVFDALTSDRPYRKGMSPSEAIEYVIAGSNTQFSEGIVRAFLNKIAPYPVGTIVSLSNDSVAIVMENYHDMCLRPKVRIIMQYDEYVKPYTIDLKNDLKSYNITVIGPFKGDIDKETANWKL